MNSKAMRSNLMLVLTAWIWGVAFVAQSVGMDYVGPFTFNSVRNFIATLVLLPCIRLLDKANAKTAADTASGHHHGGRTLIIGGIVCGVCLAVASSFQQIGIAYTTVGKAGFITAMYIIIVPLLGLFVGKKVRLLAWGSVALAIIGLYLLCMTESLSLGKGDLLVLICAFCFSLHILAIDYFSPKVDGVRMSCIQFLTCGIICAVPALLTESPDIHNILAAWMPILYAGALSSAVGYTLQIVAQKNTDPVIASLLMSLESTFSLLAGWVLLGQKLSPRELLGCLIMFIAIILAQLPDRPKA
jgi:drug/metabolite transporter (DMT)-like permease